MLTFFFVIFMSIIINHILAQSKDKGGEKEEFECPPNSGNGNFADPVTCRRFYQVKKKSTKKSKNLIKFFVVC